MDYIKKGKYTWNDIINDDLINEILTNISIGIHDISFTTGSQNWNSLVFIKDSDSLIYLRYYETTNASDTGQLVCSINVNDKSTFWNLDTYKIITINNHYQNKENGEILTQNATYEPTELYTLLINGKQVKDVNGKVVRDIMIDGISYYINNEEPKYLTLDSVQLQSVISWESITLTNGWTLNGTQCTWNSLEARTTSRNQILKVGNKKKISLKQGILPYDISYTLYSFNSEASISSSTLISTTNPGTWVKTDYDIPLTAKYMIIIFKRDDGNSFSEDDLNLLKNTITFTY